MGLTYEQQDAMLDRLLSNYRRIFYTDLKEVNDAESIILMVCGHKANYSEKFHYEFQHILIEYVNNVITLADAKELLRNLRV